ICDLIADVRALTPSEAAEKVKPDRAAVLQWLERLETQLRGLLMKRWELARARLDDLAGRRCFTNPLDRIRDEERRLDERSERILRAVKQRLEAAKRRLESLAARL